MSAHLLRLLAIALLAGAAPAWADSDAIAFRLEMPFGGPTGSAHHLSFQTDPVLAERVARLNHGMQGGESFTAPRALQPTDPHSEFYVPPLVEFNWRDTDQAAHAHWFLPWVVDGRDVNLQEPSLGSKVLTFGTSALTAGSRAWQALSLHLHSSKAAAKPQQRAKDVSASQR